MTWTTAAACGTLDPWTENQWQESRSILHKPHYQHTVSNRQFSYHIRFKVDLNPTFAFALRQMSEWVL